MQNSSTNSTIIEITDFDLVKQYLLKAKVDSLVLIDVDDCIITPVSAMFVGNSTHRFFIDDLKKDKAKYANFDEILETWRKNRKIKLLNNAWPNLIEQVTKNGADVYALTQLTGIKVGSDTLREWRYKELNSFKINFIAHFMNSSEATIIEAEEGNKALFYKGIFITGARKKGLVLEQILTKIMPNEIIFVDDRIDHVHDLADVCKAKMIDYVGICYRRIDVITAEINEEIIKLQKEYLIEKMQWLEDEEALALLKK